jgi:hypothetical protein
MASFTFNIEQFVKSPSAAVDTAKQFTISGPATLTREQAQAIFEKQVSTGGLTGFKTGDVLSAATQAAAGLASAQSQLTGGLSALGATVSKATNGITSALTKTPVVNGINPADFVTQIPGLTSIASLSSSQVTGTLSSASKLLNQPSDLLSNSKGLGEFGLDSKQLETAGYLKPGTTSKFLSSGQNSLSSVLNSPSVWSGKDGINQVENLLTNTTAQNKIQQGLMTQGLDQLKGLGLPVDSLSPQVLSGVALNAAKDVTATLDWAKGQTAGLSPDLKAQFDQAAKNGSFAVNLVDEKLNNQALNIKQVVGATNTVNSATLTAAVGRVIGNDKIPSLNYSGTKVDSAVQLQLRTLSQSASNLDLKLAAITSDNLTSDTVDAREAKLTALKNEYTALRTQLESLKASVAGNPAFVTKVDVTIAGVDTALAVIETDFTNIRQFKAALQSI